MNLHLDSDYIARRMNEIGYGNIYTLRMRHFSLIAGQELMISGPNQFFILTEPVEMTTIESDTGLFDVSSSKTNELHYEHSGTILIKNHSCILRHIRFMQVIPKT